MNLSLLDNALWAASLAGNAALLFVLLYRGRWRQFPCFTIWIAYESLYNALLALIYRFGSHSVYAWTYWSCAIVDVALQIAVIVEIARIVLRPTGAWSADARGRFFGVGAAGAVLAMALAWGAHPSAPTSLAAWEIRASLFTSILICELFTAILMASQQLGLVWRNHVMRLGQGLTVWSIVCFAVDAAHSYYGGVRHFNLLEHLSILAFLAAQIWWIVSFWAAEPARKPLSPEMQRYLVDLHQRVQYDLANVVKAQGKEPTHTA
ncbi:MAG: hypothetical protein ACR2JE_15880 [Acidobacteriaceae bacterium]